MQTIPGLAEAPSFPTHQGDPTSAVPDLLREALRDLLEGDGELPRTAREGSAAALAILEEGAPSGAGFRLVHYRGQQEFFPGRLASLLYLAGIQLLLERGDIDEDANIERDVLRMLRAGDTDAANLLFDRITGTLSGPELPSANLEAFAKRRGRLDELLRGAGISGTRCRQKIWERSPYGRDAQLLAAEVEGGENRLTAVSLASLLAKVLLGELAGLRGSARMRDLLKLDAPDGGPDSETALRLAARLPSGSRVWGRRDAGPRLLHEVVAVELPSGARYALAFLSRLGERHSGALENLGRTIAGAVSR